MSWFNTLRKKTQSSTDVTGSILYDEKTFYNRFTQDLLEAKNEVIIESPYITSRRMKILRPIFQKLVSRGVKVYIMTRDPKEHDLPQEYQSEEEIRNFESIGIQTLLCLGNHHRKLAIIDRKILFEGSLNILSQSHSREIMRRIDSTELSEEMYRFLKYEKLMI
ncbi:MAG: phospholipase D-like domain-containing protein [Candidatus Woykebacteria bacterium]